MHGPRERSSDDVISDMNVIPFVDICLVMLIIVLVTAAYSVSLIDFTVPQGQPTEYIEASAAVTVDVSQDGRCTIRGKTVTADELRRAVQAPVIVRAGRSVKAQHVVSAVDQLRAAGQVSLTFLIRESE